MAVGDLTMSTPTECLTVGSIKTAVDLLNLAAVDDFIMVTVIPGRDIGWLVYKIERASV